MEQTRLNAEQQAAVDHERGPILVVAGAGTGKTQVITRRIAHLIETKKARPEEIVALTFTEKAAREMEERVDQLLPYGTVQTQIMTFHAFGDLLLKEYAADVGLTAAFKVMSKTQQIVFVKDRFDSFNFNYFAPVGSPDRYLDSLVTYFSRLKEELVSVETYLKFAQGLAEKAGDEAQKLEAAKQLELAQAFGVYVEQTRQAGLLDFGDQISLAIELLEKRPNILNQVQARVKYLLVDEFQDTNLAQNRLLELLAGEGGNIMVVGDDDQSIYKFRGAAISNILKFTDHFKSVEQVVLTQNYRSTQEILDAAYRLIQHNNPDRLEVRNEINKYLKAQTSGPMPQLITAPTYSLEADAIAADITNRLSKGEPASEILVLVRQRNHAEPVAKALSAANVPYRLGGSQSLYRQPEIELIFDFLQYITDPNDSLSLYHLLASEVYRADLAELMAVAGTARRRNLPMERLLKDEPGENAEFNRQIEAFGREVERWRELSARFSVGELVFDFLKATGYLDRLTEASRRDPAVEIKIRNISRFFGLLGEFEAVARDKSAMAYILQAEALREAGEEPEAGETDLGQNEVQIMTVHKAKGLEFDTVYIFNLIRGVFPSVRRRGSLELPLDLIPESESSESDWHLQEERRLMYVALTRARRNLVLSWSPDHGGQQSKKPSQFISEALGVDPPALSNDKTLTPLQQIELFEAKIMIPPNLKPKFMQGEVLSLTPHQIDDYLTCPENFRYLYILEVPQLPKPALMYGSLIHGVINQYYLQRKAGKTNLDQLLAMVPGLWRSDGFISAGQEQRRLEQAKATIKRFFAREETATVIPTHSEKEFQVEIPEYKVIVRGRFDAVYVAPDGTVEIRDFKTSQVEDSDKADEKAKSSVQLAIYALAWQRLTGKLPDRVVLDFVETGRLGTATKTEADLAKTLAAIGEVAQGIRGGQFTPGKSCFYCSHRKVIAEVELKL